MVMLVISCLYLEISWLSFEPHHEIAKLFHMSTINVQTAQSDQCLCFDSLHPINNLSVKQGQVFLG